MVFLWPNALHDPLFAVLERSLIDGTQQRGGCSRAQCTRSPMWSGCQGVKAAAAGSRWPAFAGRFDISEREDAFELVTDAPGFDASDIAVEVEEGVLTISAKHEECKEQELQQRREQEKQQQQQQQQDQQQQDQQQDQEEHPEQWSFVDAPKEGEAKAQPGEQQAELNSQQDHSGEHQVKEQQPSGSAGVDQAVIKSKPVGGSQFWRRERHLQQFVRRFKLPDEAKADGIIARLDKGVLTVTVPKLPPAPKPQATRIQVQG